MLSPLQKKRLHYTPIVPSILQDLLAIGIQEEQKPKVVEEIKKNFPTTCNQPIISFQKQNKILKKKPLKIGVVFSGGQAAGGHNVISALFDALQTLSSQPELIGFLNGPGGIIKNITKILTKDMLASYRNQGGFDLIGSGRDKIETPEQLKASLHTVTSLALDGLVIIGGDDSNTNAAHLAEYFRQNHCSTKVIGIPKTIDGDLRNDAIPISFGFDTACKVYSELIGNIARDALSAKKYYHFIRLMGRSASHITLECAFQTRPNMALIAEEILEKKRTLQDIIKELTDLIILRSQNNKNYGVILLPEGLIEFIPEIKNLIKHLNQLLATSSPHFSTFNSLNIEEKIAWLEKHLSSAYHTTFFHLPSEIQKQLLLDRDPHGNVQVSKIDTEKLLIDLIRKELKKRKDFSGKFHAQSHFFGYEGRAALPSNFDATYCYSLGLIAALCIYHNLTSYICSIPNVTSSTESWQIQAFPLTAMMDIEERKGEEKPVIKKALIDLQGKFFTQYATSREDDKLTDTYLCPGPMQFFQEKDLTDATPLTV